MLWQDQSVCLMSLFASSTHAIIYPMADLHRPELPLMGRIPDGGIGAKGRC